MKYYFLISFLLLSLYLKSQNPSKKVLSENDYATWKTIEKQKISSTGNLIAYELNPQKGDGKLIIRHSSGKTDTISRGRKPEIGAGDIFISFTISQPEDTVRSAKIRKLKKDEMPEDSLGIYIAGSGKVIKFPKLKSVAVAEENGTWVAFTTAETKKNSANNERKQKSINQPGDDLVLFNPQTSDTTVFHHVTEFIPSKKGTSIFIVQQVKDSLTTFSSLKRFDTENAKSVELYKSEGFVKKAVADEMGVNYAFLFSTDTTKAKSYSLYLGKYLVTNPSKSVDGSIPGMPAGWSPSEYGTIHFSKDATKLFLGTAPSPVPEPKDTIPDDEKPNVDIWNWKDISLQSQQKVELEREKKRSYLAVYHLDIKRFLQLADPNCEEIRLIQKGNGDVALGEDDTPYKRAKSWTGNSNRDFYLTDIKTGIKRRIAINKERLWLSPAGKFVVWYEQSDSSYYARSTRLNDLKIVPLTKMIPVGFYDEENDVPDWPRPYGIAGWSENDRFVFIYDRFDIWRIDPTGEKVPVCVTLAFGRRNQIQLRYIKTDPEEEFIPPGKLSILSGFNQETMSSGFFGTDLLAIKEPGLLVMTKNRYGTPQKAKNANKIIWTKESSSEFPDLWYSNLAFELPVKISRANPQQHDYNWLTSELVEWKSFTGEMLKGLLYKPENFNPTLKYPMIVYFYEKNSQNLYRYPVPAPSRSTINRAFYCSNGYLVFVPDITYRIGYPGQSAYDDILSGVYSLAEKNPWMDINHIGLQGQSWGGYQTAYLITRTNLFAAAMAGAPVSNMTSAYGGIRWETGISRMFQYEHTQSRIGGTLWEKPLHYIENSPLFSAPNVETPLLMMHNDNDGAVPWYQGIEFFVALRRLDKPVWMLTYNGEPHNLKAESWANRMDLDKRMFQFFNHFLKGEKMPEWMERGIPAVEKGKNPGY